MSRDSPVAEFAPVECPDCGAVSVRSADDRSPCCDRPVREVDPDEFPIEPPSIDDLLGIVFGMTRTELDVCLCVMEVGEATTDDIAEEVGVDRSHVSRHLNHLVDLGVLEKHQRLLEAGGRVHVYKPADLETVRRNFTVGLFAWMDEAVDVVGDVSREKVEAITELTGDDSTSKIYHDVSDSPE